MIRHIVLIKPTNVEAVEKTLAHLPSVVDKVDGMIAIETGVDFSGRCQGYTHLFIMDFENEDALKGWGPHPEHAPIRESLMANAEMIVFDYNI